MVHTYYLLEHVHNWCLGILAIAFKKNICESARINYFFCKMNKIFKQQFLIDILSTTITIFYRWRLLLSVSLVNGFFIVSGFLLNFKEISRMFFECCEFKEPFNSINTNTYEIWSFVLLIAEPFLRPLTWLLFYFYYLMNDPSMD